MKRIGLVGLCLAVLAGTSLADQNLNPKVLDLLQQVIQQVKSGELTQSHLEALIRHQNPFEKKSVTLKQSVDGLVRLLVDYTSPLSEMIQDCRFDYVKPDINENNFPVNRRPNGEVAMKVFTTKELVGTTRSVTSKEVLQALEKKGFRRAELPEGLAYAKANPDEQRKCPIVILGSVWRRFLGRVVPCLWYDGGGRFLILYWFENDWGGGSRFLAVRKS